MAHQKRAITSEAGEKKEEAFFLPLMMSEWAFLLLLCAPLHLPVKLIPYIDACPAADPASAAAAECTVFKSPPIALNAPCVCDIAEMLLKPSLKRTAGQRASSRVMSSSNPPAPRPDEVGWDITPTKGRGI